eukprot:SAG22_NODE_6847_length_804_cov_1.330496_2_plen_183_part_00
MLPLPFLSKTAPFRVVCLSSKAAGADLEAEAEQQQGLRPLHMAAMSGQTAAVAVLLELGADKDSLPAVAAAAAAAAAAAKSGWPALQWAAAAGHLEIVQALAAAGARVPPSAVALAEAKGHTAVVQYLGSLNSSQASRRQIIDVAMATLQRAKAAEGAGQGAAAVELYTDSLTVLVEHVRCV